MSKHERPGAWAGKSSACERAEAILGAWNELTDWEQRYSADYAARQISAVAPIPPFTTYEAEAEDWARLTGERELCAYLAAIWRALPEARRQAFLVWARAVA